MNHDQNKTKLIESQLQNTLQAIETPKPSYRGKVRDVFEKGNELFIVATDRVSAFDQVLGTIPFKGAMLTEQACFWLNKTADIFDNHLIERVDPQIMRCKKAKAFGFEIIVRGYLAGSLMRTAPNERGKEYGISIDPNVGNHQPFETPIITPTTKADIGSHDLPISLNKIVQNGWATQSQMDEITRGALALFRRGSDFASQQGLILVDTKYEFGLIEGKVILIDEIHTADSSRFWLRESYQDRVSAGAAPEMLDKERLRQKLLDKGYDGSDLNTLPHLNDDMRIDLAEHYWKLTEQLLGKPFQASSESASERVCDAIRQWMR